MKTRILAIGSGMALLFCTLMTGSGASATAPSTPSPVTTDLVVGQLDGPVKAKKNGIRLKARVDTAVRTFTLTYPAGSNSGWHEHPGIVIAVVERGMVTRKLSNCTSQTFTAGQAFTEVGRHFVYNPGKVDAVLHITHLLPLRDLAKPRIERNPPRHCS